MSVGKRKIHVKHETDIKSYLDVIMDVQIFQHRSKIPLVHNNIVNFMEMYADVSFHISEGS